MRPNRPFAPAATRAALILALLAGLLPLLWAGSAPGARAQSPAAPGQAQQGAAAGVQVGLEGARLVDFIRFLGQFLGGAPLLREDQIPPIPVSVVAPEPMAQGEVRELLELVLRPVGLEAVRRGGVSYVLPAATPSAPQPPLPENAQILAWRLPAATNSDRTQAVAGVLESLRSDRGRTLSSGRLVVLADEAGRVARLRPVLQTLSLLPPAQVPEIVPLARAQARPTARALDMQMKGGAFSVLALEWSNSLLLAGTPEALERARALVAQADGAGPDAPVLKAYRPRHLRPDRLLAGLGEKLGAGAGSAQAPRLSLDEGGQAVLALASPEALARLDRLVEDLDQPRPRVYIEALVAEFSPEALAELALADEQPQPAGQPGANAARVGSAIALRGRVVDAAQLGMEALAALWSREAGVRVLAVPRLAVLEGAEARVSGGQFGAQTPGGPDGERFRLSMTPRLEPGQAGASGRVLLRLVLEDALEAVPLAGRTLETALAEGQLLLVGAPGPEGRAKGGWALLAPPRKAGDQGRLVVVASARVVRPAAVDRGIRPAAGPAGEAGGPEARDKK